VAVEKRLEGKGPLPFWCPSCGGVLMFILDEYADEKYSREYGCRCGCKKRFREEFVAVGWREIGKLE